MLIFFKTNRYVGRPCSKLRRFKSNELYRIVVSMQQVLKLH